MPTAVSSKELISGFVVLAKNKIITIHFANSFFSADFYVLLFFLLECEL